MTSQKKGENQITFGKWWAKNQGWAATADIEKGNYWKAINYKFLPSYPLNDEEKEKNHRKKHCTHICTVPDNYTGLIVTESSIYGARKCERWFWRCENGKITGNGESIKELYA